MEDEPYNKELGITINDICEIDDLEKLFKLKSYFNVHIDGIRSQLKRYHNGELDKSHDWYTNTCYYLKKQKMLQSQVGSQFELYRKIKPEEHLVQINKKRKQRMQQIWQYLKSNYPNVASNLESYLDKNEDKMYAESVFKEYSDSIQLQDEDREVSNNDEVEGHFVKF